MTELDHLWLGVRALLLLGVANGAPILAKKLLGTRWQLPLDGGLRWFDGRPLLGSSKTLRGLVASLLATALAAVVLGVGVRLGALIAAGAMLGDALASFTKRRLGIAPSGRSTGLDQVPEALLPLLMARQGLGLSLVDVLVITALFFVLEPPLARLFHLLGWRDRPY